TRTTHTASTAGSARSAGTTSTTGPANGPDCTCATRSTGSRATVTALGVARITDRARSRGPTRSAGLRRPGQSREAGGRRPTDVPAGPGNSLVGRVRDVRTATSRRVHHRRGRHTGDPHRNGEQCHPSFHSHRPLWLVG